MVNRGVARGYLETFSCDVAHCTIYLDFRNDVNHQDIHNSGRHPFTIMFKDKSRHDHDGNHSPRQYICNLSILQASDILSLDLTDVVISEKAVSGSRTSLMI